MIGFFDSWKWWLLVMQEFQSYFPNIPMIIEMDIENCPYGNKDTSEIRSLTKAWVDRLFARWASVVILACNTASVHALRWLQQEIYPDKHILGVMIPGAEKIIEMGYKRIWVLATEATVRIRAYKERVHFLDDSIYIEEVWAPELVPLIESWIYSQELLHTHLSSYIASFSPDIEALILGCTHFPYIKSDIIHIWNSTHNTPTPVIIDPGKESAKKFQQWITRHSIVLK